MKNLSARHFQKKKYAPPPAEISLMIKWKIGEIRVRLEGFLWTKATYHCYLVTKTVQVHFLDMITN